MKYVFLILLASLLCKPAVESEYIKSIIESLGYIFYSTAWASIYLVPSAIGAAIATKMLQKNKNLTAILVSVLSACMAISAILSLVMINRVFYYELLDFKGLWQGVYTSIEILIAITVGFNGLGYLAHMGDFTYRGVKAPINPDLDHWNGKYK